MSPENPKEQNSETLFIRLSPETHAEIKLLSAITGISMAEYGREAMQYILEKNKKIIAKHYKKAWR